ncbi:MAG: hypothetical protein Q4G60_15395, partial [bacterium]|nr:hypothetical protein [bacterium]
MQNRRMKKIIWDSILIMLVLVILGGVLYLVQTRFSMRQQEENFELELDLAERKLAANQTTVTESRASFDAFSQAKADTLAYYYRAHATDDLAREAEEWELKELYVLDMDHKIVASNRTAEITRELEQTFEDLIKTQQPVDADMTAYYIARLGDGRILIAGRDLQNEYDYENSLLDPKTALSDVRIGNTGYIVAVDSNEGVITYHPQKELIGKSVEEVGISRRHLVDDYYGWITRQDRQFYCHCKQTGDTILIATIPETEVKSYSIRKIEMILAMFAVILIIIVTYVNMIHGDRLKNHQHQNEKDVIQIGKHLYFDKILAGKCKNILVIGIVLIFCSSYYIQWLSILSAQTVSFDNKLKAMNIVFDENKATLSELENGYNNEYARRAENIAALISHEPSLLDDNKMMDLTKRAQIESIYVFDDQGKVEVTNTAYKDFTLSRKEEDQSYAFWDVVKGYKTVLVQEAMEDDTTEHGYMQYIGVARQDAPGMVQIAVAPKRLQARIKTTKLTYALHDVAVEN